MDKQVGQVGWVRFYTVNRGWNRSSNELDIFINGLNNDFDDLISFKVVLWSLLMLFCFNFYLALVNDLMLYTAKTVKTGWVM